MKIHVSICACQSTFPNPHCNQSLVDCFLQASAHHLTARPNEGSHIKTAVTKDTDLLLIALYSICQDVSLSVTYQSLEERTSLW